MYIERQRVGNRRDRGKIMISMYVCMFCIERIDEREKERKRESLNKRRFDGERQRGREV